MYKDRMSQLEPGEKLECRKCGCQYQPYAWGSPLRETADLECMTCAFPRGLPCHYCKRIIRRKMLEMLLGASSYQSEITLGYHIWCARKHPGAPSLPQFDMADMRFE